MRYTLNKDKMSKAIIGSDTIAQTLRFHANKKWNVPSIIMTSQTSHVKNFITEMKSPRVVMNTENSMQNIETLSKCLEPGDTLIDFSEHYFKDVTPISLSFESKSINYLSSSISSNRNGMNLLISGSLENFKNVLFLNEMCSSMYYIDNAPEKSSYYTMIYNVMREALFQGIYDAFAYSEQDNEKFSKVMKQSDKSDIQGLLLSNFNIADQPISDKRFNKYKYDYGIITPVINNSIETKNMNNYLKYVHTTVPSNNFFSPYIAVNALRFFYACVFLEALSMYSQENMDIPRVMKSINSATKLSCPMNLYSTQQLYDVLELTHNDTRLFVNHCLCQAIPCPAIQGALSYFDNLKYLQIPIEKI